MATKQSQQPAEQHRQRVRREALKRGRAVLKAKAKEHGWTGTGGYGVCALVEWHPERAYVAWLCAKDDGRPLERLATVAFAEVEA